MSAGPPETASAGAGVKEQSRQINASFVFLALCCALFLISVSLRLNGSSSAIWGRVLNAPDEATGLIAGIPRMTRSDEWLMWTPAVLSQLHHVPPMPVQNLALGAGASPLLMSLPVRHYTMFFRPQLWGFFIFDAERGFAWFWAAKLFGLLVATFLLFRLALAGWDWLALCAAIVVVYSSCVQWFFSSPAMLPEMIACWAAMLLTGRALFRAGGTLRKIAAGIGFAACAINFALCCYPPFQIPLVYLALTLFGVFVWQHRRTSLRSGLLWLGGTAAVTLALLWPTLVELRPTLEVVANTSYPGARRGTGGTMSVTQLFFGLLNFLDGRRVHAEMYPNTSEASNFFPIWVAAIAGLFWRWSAAWRRGGFAGLRSGATPLLVALVGFILFFTTYAVVGLPEWLCRITALNFVTEKRALLAIALAGFLLTFASLPRDGATVARRRTLWWIGLGVAGACLFYVLSAQRLNPAYLTPGFCAIYTALATLLGCLYFCARPAVFAGVFAGTLLLNNFLVNPIAEGLPILLRSEAAQRIARIHRADPDALWAVYDGGTTAPFITATGARVFNGIKTVPDLELLGRMDPSGTYRSVYNRYAFVALELPRDGEREPVFQAYSGDVYRAMISPFDPVLTAAGLKYVVFPRQLTSAELGRLNLLAAMPESQIWIYAIRPRAELPTAAVAAN